VRQLRRQRSAPGAAVAALALEEGGAEKTDARVTRNGAEVAERGLMEGKAEAPAPDRAGRTESWVAAEQGRAAKPAGGGWVGPGSWGSPHSAAKLPVLRNQPRGAAASSAGGGGARGKQLGPGRLDLLLVAELGGGEGWRGEVAAAAAEWRAADLSARQEAGRLAAVRPAIGLATAIRKHWWCGENASRNPRRRTPAVDGGAR
jgi:hypothetical protein